MDIGVIVAAALGVTFVFYRYPAGYRKLFPWFGYANMAALLAFFGWYVGFSLSPDLRKAIIELGYAIGGKGGWLGETLVTTLELIILGAIVFGASEVTMAHYSGPPDHRWLFPFLAWWATNTFLTFVAWDFGRQAHGAQSAAYAAELPHVVIVYAFFNGYLIFLWNKAKSLES